MKIFKITILVVALALLGGTFTVDAKAKKRRSTKKEKQIVKKDIKDNQSVLYMVECGKQGMEMSPISQVRVERKDGKVVCVIKGTRTSEIEYLIPDGDEILRDALEIIEQEKMFDYESEYEPDPNNLLSDGFSWSFKAKLADGRSVSSKGHNAGPDGLYSEGAEKLTKLLFERARKCGLDMVEYSFQGMRMDPLAYMRVEWRNYGKVVMIIKGTVTDEKEYVIKDGERILYEALGIIEEENMLEYDKIYTFKTERGERILDGYTWSFAAKLKDGRSVSSKGRNAGPGGKGLNRIGVLLRKRAEKLLKEEQE